LGGFQRSDFEEQLALLRAREARISARYASAGAAPARERPKALDIAEILPGGEVATPLGAHFETSRLYPRTGRHGSFELSCFEELPADLLSAISSEAIPNFDIRRVAFLDTETTGLAGGSGTCAFLIGVGAVTEHGFELRQFFMRDYDEEASQLHALSETLAGFDVLITYNGRTYDQPLLESRYILARQRPPFARLEHLDLLTGARRLWKLRFESCRLVELEHRILGHERQGDIPGELIPEVYFDYVRFRNAQRLKGVFDHNALDILTLACLTAIIPQPFQALDLAALRHGEELAGLGRWARTTGRLEEASALFRRAIDAGLKDHLLFRTIWDLAQVERKLGRQEAAVNAWTELSKARNPHRVQALVELAKYYERTAREPEQALRCTLEALRLDPSPELARRRERLEGKLSRCGGALPG